MKKSELKENKLEEKLTISDFLEFLKISCQLNKVISGDKYSSPDVIDFNKLTENIVIKNLIDFSEYQKRTGESKMTNGNSVQISNSKKGLNPILEEKLDGILSEGILDSIIPFICPIQLTLPITSQTKCFKIKHRDQSPRVGSIQPGIVPSIKQKIEKNLTDSEKSIVVYQEMNQRKRRKSSSSNITVDDSKNE